MEFCYLLARANGLPVRLPLPHWCPQIESCRSGVDRAGQRRAGQRATNETADHQLGRPVIGRAAWISPVLWARSESAAAISPVAAIGHLFDRSAMRLASSARDTAMVSGRCRRGLLTSREVPQGHGFEHLRGQRFSVPVRDASQHNTLWWQASRSAGTPAHWDRLRERVQVCFRSARMCSTQRKCDPCPTWVC